MQYRGFGKTTRSCVFDISDAGHNDRVSVLGLDGIDIHTRAFASEDPAYLRDIRMRCLQRGLAISYIGVSNNFGRPQEELPEVVADVKHWVDVAEFMGIPLVRIFAAWIPEGEPEEQVWERMMPCMEEVAAYGQEKGVVLGLHNHNHGCVTRTGKEVRKIFRIGSIFESLEGVHPKLCNRVKLLYDRTIDYGAHPNSPDLFSNLETEDLPDGGKKYKVIYLSGDSTAKQFALCKPERSYHQNPGLHTQCGRQR